jgi:hypothetical protein
MTWRMKQRKSVIILFSYRCKTHSSIFLEPYSRTEKNIGQDSNSQHFELDRLLRQKSYLHSFHDSKQKEVKKDEPCGILKSFKKEILR